MNDFVYVKSRVSFDHLSNGDLFVGVDPSNFIGKPIDVEFKNEVVGTVLDAYGDKRARMFETFIGPYYPDGFGYVEIVAVIDSKSAASLKIQESNEFSMGCSGFMEDENSKLEITGVSLLQTPIDYGRINVRNV